MNGVYTLGYSLRWSFVYLSARPRATAPHEPKLSFISSRVAVTGSERVELSVLEPGRTSLTLHAHQVVLTREPALAVKGGANLTAAGVSYNYALQTVTIDFGRELPVGDATLSLSFRGTLNDELAGFYRSRYTLRGESRNAAVTQFEATDARRAFPCWDEPAAKAVFELTVTAPADRTVLSNMHAVRVSTSADGRSRTHEFAPSPVMSSYLVAVVVGEFDAVSRTCANGVLTTVYTPVGKAALGSFALDVATKALDLLEGLYRVPFMGSKNDHVAIADFSAGAMVRRHACGMDEGSCKPPKKHLPRACHHRDLHHPRRRRTSAS
jgi:puromycin-sensitive aminopeptidase